MSGVALVGIVHDTEARYLPVLARDLPPLREHYAAISAICGPWTAPATIDALRAAGGVNVIVDETIPVNARPYALNLIATQRTWTHVHLTDLDHALHWARCWPEELDTVNAEIAAHDFLLLGRTPRATATLPDSQRETEHLINLMFDRTTADFANWRRGVEREPMDICTGAWGLSRDAAALLQARAKIANVGFHAEWPLIIRDTPSLRAAYLPCEGLDYETADRYEDAIDAAGGIDAWHAAQTADIHRWQQRLVYVTQIADAIAAYGTA